MKYTTICLLCALVFFSCKKKTEVLTLTLKEETKQWATLKPGSYIIYQDSLHPAVKDSFWVDNFKDEIVEPLDKQQGKYQRISYDLLNTGNLQFRVLATPYGNGDMIRIHFRYRGDHYTTFYGDPSVQYILYVANVPFQPFEKLGNKATYYRIHQLLSNYSCANRTYEKAVFSSGMLRAEEEGFDFDPTYFATYFSSTHNLVKMEIRTDTSRHIWEQVDAHLVR